MAEIKFECSHCKQHLACDDKYSGRKISCPACKALTVVPGVPYKSGMTFMPEDWQKSDANAGPSASQKTGMTHLPESWPKPPEVKPESPT